MHILTAAHCFGEREARITETSYSFRLGTHDGDKNQEVNVQEINSQLPSL